MDILNQGIALGRFLGTRITLSFGHIIMLLYMASYASQQGPIGMGIVALVYFLSILLHEFGHVAACKAVGGIADAIILGPMGGLAAVQPPDRPLQQFITTAGGPAVNALLLAICWGAIQVPVVVEFLGGNTQLGVALGIFLSYMILLNQILLLLNLLPIYPMDGGRLLQNILWPLVGYRNSVMVTGMIGTVGGGALIVLGTGLTTIRIPYVNFTLGNGMDYFLLMIGLTCIMASWGLYQRSQEIQHWRKN